MDWALDNKWALISAVVAGFVGVYFLRKRHSVDKRVKQNKNVVITGSSKGIGFGLAKKFLELGNNVVICSRNADNVQQAVKALQEYNKYENKILGKTVDVTNYDSIEELVQFTKKELGTIDIWVSNAGVSQEVLGKLTDTPVNTIDAIVNTNLLGTIYCMKAVTIELLKQENGGHIFNMSGAGTNGWATPRFLTYGATKASFLQLMKSMVKETASTKVGIHTLSPGMVITDLLVKKPTETYKPPYKIFNILAEKADTVADWLVPRILGASQPGKTGKSIEYLTFYGVLWRFLTAPFRSNRIINEKTGEIL